MDLENLPDLDGWLPIRIDWKQDPPAVDWCHVGKARFTDSFFEQTIEKCLRHPFNLIFRRYTSLEGLAEWQTIRPGLLPSGFIFHMSRCGSTLIAQMLAALPQNIVISEAPPIDGILRGKNASEDEKIAWLRGMLNAFAQPRNGNEKHFFVKFDSWHTFDLALVRRAFPDVPWIFLYRDPLEVMASQMKRRAIHLVPGLVELTGLELLSAAQMPAEEYCARVLSSLCATARDQLRIGGGRAVNYTELPGAVCTSLREFFHLDCTAAELDQMRHVTQFDAKSPSLFFDANAAAKNTALTPLSHEMSARWLDPVYAELEALRKAQDGTQLKMAS
jgi:gluconate kinase